MSIFFIWLLLLVIGEFESSLCFCPTDARATRRQRLTDDYSSAFESINVSRFQLQKHDESILGTIRMDYSAANEYIRAHYGDQSPRLPLYFEQDESTETVYDARFGVYSCSSTTKDDSLMADTKTKTAATLKNCGFTLLSKPPMAGGDAETEKDDWDNVEAIQRNFLPQLRECMLKELYPDQQRSIRHILFWNPMLRGPSKPKTMTVSNNKSDNAKVLTPKASYAALPHIDMDVNAYGDKFEDFMDLMENNELTILDSRSFPADGRRRRQDILDSIQNKNRGFAVVNVWCNVGKHPVRKDPLGLFSVRYNETASVAAFPMAAPDMTNSRWYAFSDMKPNEVLFFCQYDRDVLWPSDLWHCSLDGIISNPGEQSQLPSRESFDIRCLLVFEEEVPPDRDRFQRAHRLGSLLSLEESGCFCEGQFEERQKEDHL